MKKIIIGITGTNGAGKGTVAEYLKTRKGFVYFSMSGFIEKEVVRRGMGVNRDTLREIGNEIRSEHGPAYIIEELYKEAENVIGPAIIESIRTIAEAQMVHQLGGIILGVDADQTVRYLRVRERKTVKDDVTIEKFNAQEKVEQYDDPGKQNIPAVLALADYYVENNTSINDLYKEVDKILISINADS